MRSLACDMQLLLKQLHTLLSNLWKQGLLINWGLEYLAFTSCLLADSAAALLLCFCCVRKCLLLLLPQLFADQPVLYLAGSRRRSIPA